MYQRMLIVAIVPLEFKLSAYAYLLEIWKN
jgi:hypothetical protein